MLFDMIPVLPRNVHILIDCNAIPCYAILIQFHIISMLLRNVHILIQILSNRVTAAGDRILEKEKGEPGQGEARVSSCINNIWTHTLEQCFLLGTMYIHQFWMCDSMKMLQCSVTRVVSFPFHTRFFPTCSVKGIGKMWCVFLCFLHSSWNI